jgi:shikimate dehydrogenase
MPMLEIPNGQAMAQELVYTLADLKHWNKSTPTLAVLGFPIAHSLSPVMHNAALQSEARHNPRLETITYVRFEIKPEDLKEALPLFHSKGFLGLNLTVPHKVIAFSLIEKIDPSASPIGAVNTLRRTQSGWEGFNTDGYGLATAVKESLDIELTDSNILLIGAGGAARGAAVECLMRKCRSLTLVNRTAQNLEELKIHLKGIAKEVPINSVSQVSLLEPDVSGIARGVLVINATSAGLKPSDLAPIDLVRLREPAGVFDMIYNPSKTQLMQQAEELGILTTNGLTMLVHQGAKALEIWTDAPSSRTAPLMLRAAREALALIR